MRGPRATTDIAAIPLLWAGRKAGGWRACGRTGRRRLAGVAGIGATGIAKPAWDQTRLGPLSSWPASDGPRAPHRRRPMPRATRSPLHPNCAQASGRDLT